MHAGAQVSGLGGTSADMWNTHLYVSARMPAPRGKTHARTGAAKIHVYTHVLLLTTSSFYFDCYHHAYFPRVSPQAWVKNVSARRYRHVDLFGRTHVDTCAP